MFVDQKCRSTSVKSIKGIKVGCPTFNADDMFPNLLSQKWIRHEFDQIVDGVDGRMDGLEPLNLVPDGHRGRVLMMLRVKGHPLRRGVPAEERGHRH